MSAELESSKDEDTKEQPKRSSEQLFLAYWQIGIKILELLLCATCMGCVYNSVLTLGIGAKDLHHLGVMYTAFTGYILINLVFLCGYVLRDTIPYKTSALFSVSGAGLFLITGVLLAVDRSEYVRIYPTNPTYIELTMLIVTVVVALANAVVFSIDAVIICGLCLGFITEPARAIGLGREYLHQAGVMYTAYTGYMLINVIFLISRLIRDRIPYKTSVLFSINGAGLFLVTGVLLTVIRNNLVNRQFFHPNIYRQTMMTTSIVLAFSNVAVFMLDASFTFARKQDF